MNMLIKNKAEDIDLQKQNMKAGRSGMGFDPSLRKILIK